MMVVNVNMEIKKKRIFVKSSKRNGGAFVKETDNHT